MMSRAFRNRTKVQSLQENITDQVLQTSLLTGWIILLYTKGHLLLTKEN